MNIEALLADRGWVARLARSLTRDEARADDLAQDGWVSALNRPPTRAVRAWWRRVLRRRAMELAREEERRRVREERAAPPRPVGPELLERLEFEQAIAEAVGALPEAYRDAILLRYFEGMPPRAIARRLGVPVETVRTRLKRAHDLLRERLDGVRRDWRAGMLLLAWPGSSLGGILAVETKKVVAGALVLCLLLLSSALVMWRGSGDHDVPNRVAEAKATAPAPDEGARTPVVPADALDAEPKGAVLGTIMGPLPVLDGKEPLAVVRVLRSGREVATGRFAPGPFRVAYDRDADARWLAEVHAPGTRLQTFALPSAEADLGEIRFYQAMLYGGHVLDLEGNPVAGATVQFRYPRLVCSSGPTGADGAFRIDLDWTTHFTVDRNGSLAGSLLDVHAKEGWLGPYYASPAGFQGQCELRVDLREVDADPVLRIVADGAPVAGVRVSVHADPSHPWCSLPDSFATGVTGDDGCISVQWPPDIRSAVVRIERTGGTVDTWVRRDEIERPEHEIEVGRVTRVAAEFVLPDGEPAEGARVWLAGEWMPDLPGKPVSSPRAAAPGYVPGSVAASLYGIVPKDGVVWWSVPVERPEGGTFHAWGWFAEPPRRRPLGRNLDRVVLMRKGDPPIRIVVEEQPGEEWRFWARFRDSRGPLVPRSAGLRLMKGGSTVVADRFQLGGVAGGSVQCWLPFDVSAIEFDSVEVYVGIEGRAPATARLPATALFAAIRDGTDLDVEVGEDAAAAFRVSRPTGEPAKRVVVTLVPESADHIAAAFQRLQAVTDDAGYVVMDCQADLAYAVVALDNVTGEGARLDGFRPGEAPRGLVLEAPQRTRVRVVFPDGAPAPKAQVNLETQPPYLAPATFAVANDDGWAELPRMVPGLFVLDVKACDRRLDIKPYVPAITHRSTVPATSIADGAAIRVPMLENLAHAASAPK